VFGVIGVAVGAFQWSASPWFVMAKQAVAEWLVERDSFALLQDNAPWWLLTHYPSANDVFTWLDGIMILSYIGVIALLLGGWIWGWLRLGGAALPGSARGNANHLAYSLIPMGGFGVFLGLSALTVTLLSGERIIMPWLPIARGLLLAVAVLWSLWLGARFLRSSAANITPKLLAFCALAMAVGGVLAPWLMLFYIW